MSIVRTNIINNPKGLKQQQGIGMVEVMVSLLLLSVAVLGFSAMQMTALKSTEDSLIRTRAMSVIRSGSEAMRANPSAIEAFANSVNNDIPVPTTGETDLRDVSITDCITYGTSLPPTSCSLKQLATRDGLAVKAFSENNEIIIGMDDCPNSGTGNLVKKCFIASWGETTAVFDDTDTKACANADGVYKAGATCFVMEAY